MNPNKIIKILVIVLVILITSTIIVSAAETPPNINSRQ